MVIYDVREVYESDFPSKSNTSSMSYSFVIPYKFLMNNVYILNLTDFGHFPPQQSWPSFFFIGCVVELLVSKIYVQVF